MNKLTMKIKKLRAKKGWTQKELAKKSGLAIVTIEKIEMGERTNLYLSTRKKLAKALGVSIMELLD